MISSKILRFALLCANSSLLYTTPGRASPISSSTTSPAAFTFPSCVESCVNVSGCGIDNPQCMCKFSSKGIFLELALTCMSYYCEAELHRADDTLINIMEAGCRSIRQSIPEEKLEMAEAWANRLVKNLPPATTTTKVCQPQLPTTAMMTLVTTIHPPPPPVTATTTDVRPPPVVSTTTKSTTTLIESSSPPSSPTSAPSPSEEPESSSDMSSTIISVLQPQSSSTKPADKAATSAPPSPPRPRPDSSPYGIGPILSSGVRGVQMMSLSSLHWASTLLCLSLAGAVFA